VKKFRSNVFCINGSILLLAFRYQDVMRVSAIRAAMPAQGVPDRLFSASV
jgi:hypothetical protein